MDQSLIDRIVAAAGPDRAISSDRLASLAPLDSMSVEDMANLIAKLESAGISVDVDPALTAPSRNAGPRPFPSATMKLPEEETGAPSITGTERLNTLSPPTAKAKGARWRASAPLLIILCLIALALVWLFATK